MAPGRRLATSWRPGKAQRRGTVCVGSVRRSQRHHPKKPIVLNCKLVQFDEDGLELFLGWHGRNNYGNEGHSRANPSEFNEILMAYAYDGSGKHYPFLRVIRELKVEEIEDAR